MTARRVIKEIIVWGITLLLALVCLRSGWLKITGNIAWVRDFHRWGYPNWFRLAVGVAELIAFALLLVPRLAGYGATIFALVMLGAIFTHAAHSESARLPFNFVLLALSVITVFARRPVFLQKITEIKVQR